MTLHVNPKKITTFEVIFCFAREASVAERKVYWIRNLQEHLDFSLNATTIALE